MPTSQFIADRLQEVFLNGTWIANTNYKDLTSKITWEEATTQVGDLNTIAALIFHVNYYLGGVLNVFRGGDLEIRDKYSFDHPPIQSEADWKRLLEEMWENAEQFIDHVKQMPDAQLATVFVDEKYGTYQRNIEGIIEHSYYHLGQISLIRKMVQGNFTPATYP